MYKDEYKLKLSELFMMNIFHWLRCCCVFDPLDVFWCLVQQAAGSSRRTTGDADIISELLELRN